MTATVSGIPIAIHEICTARIHAGGWSGPLETEWKYGPVIQAMIR
jgi:hypothetical protein